MLLLSISPCINVQANPKALGTTAAATTMISMSSFALGFYAYAKYLHKQALKNIFMLNKHTSKIQ